MPSLPILQFLAAAALVSCGYLDYPADPELFCSSDSASQDFGRRAYHQSIVYESSEGPKILVDGGELYYALPGRQATALPSNSTYTISLSKPWSPKDVDVSCLDKGDSPHWNLGRLWPNPDKNGSVFLFYGQLSEEYPVFSRLRRGQIKNAPDFVELMPKALDVWEFYQDQWARHSTAGVDAGVYVAATYGDGRAYFLGGRTSWYSSRETFQTSDKLLGFSQYDGQWSTRDLTRQITGNSVLFEPFLHHIKIKDQEFLIAFGGNTGVDGDAKKPSLRTLDSISVYKIGSDDWVTQQARGPIPIKRRLSCSVAVKGDNGTWEIYIFGGSALPDEYGFRTTEPSTNQYLAEVSVLSIPSFRWHTVDGSRVPSRAAHTCHVVGGSQMIAIGGMTPNLEKDLQSADPWPQGLGLFDLNELKWKDSYDPDNGAYRTPQKIRDSIAKDGRYPSPWDDARVGEWFEALGSDEADGDPSNGPDPEDDDGNSSGGSKTNIGAIVGGVLGGIVALALLATGIFCLIRQRKRDARAKETTSKPEGQDLLKTPHQFASYGYPHSYSAEDPTQRMAVPHNASAMVPHTTHPMMPHNAPPMMPAQPTEISGRPVPMEADSRFVRHEMQG